LFDIIMFMNTVFIEFRDPLFGIIIFFVIVFVVALFSYWWGRFKTKEDHHHLDRFLRKFRSPPSSMEIKELIDTSAIPIDSWLLLANSYSNNGEYAKCIDIYHGLLSKREMDANQKEIMFLLGQTYFKAGFLERSKTIFLEILKMSPRTPQALRYLLLVYEYLKDYKAAMDVLEPLEELDVDVLKDRVYLTCLLILNDFALSSEQKAQKLLEIYKEHQELTYLIFEYLLQFHPRLAWQNLDHSQSKKLSSLFWNLDKEAVDFDIIARNSYLRELFSAKGYVSLESQSAVFEFDVLIHLHKSAYRKAIINFEYMCENCKQVFPFAFYRCSHCHSIDTLVAEPVIAKEHHETFDSFL
jgi:lipopolysaccharide assembly protein B